MTTKQALPAALRSFGSLALLAALLGSGPVDAKPASDGKVVRYEQLVFAMGGHEVGTTTATDIETATGYRLERDAELKLTRGATVIEMTTRSVAVVTKDFRPVRFTFEKRDAAGLFVLNGTISGNQMTLKTSGTGSGETVIELPPNTTFASAADLLLRRDLKAGKKLNRPVIIEEMGAVKVMTAAVSKRKDGEPGFLIEAQLAGLTMREELDERGYTRISRTPALGAVAYPVGSVPPDDVKAGSVDMLARSTWTAPILDKGVTRVRYRITTPDASSFALPTDRRQKVINRTAAFVDVEVTGQPSTKGPLSAKERKRLLRATPYEATTDPAIKATAARVTKGARSTREKVERLTKFVYGHVDAKSLDRGYAPATETLRSKTGDCTEHSVLLSALLRSQGIPTRLVDGVVVDGGRAGYHEWVEVQIDREGFVPADPTFGEFPASPARLKLAEGTSDPDGLLDLGIAAGRILRPGVTIEVLGAE